jgi:type IX secretion system PorP/SprF family membrane protein
MGVSFFSDKAGASQMGVTQVALNGTYHIHLSKENTLGGGIQAGLGQRSINTSNLKWDNQFDGDVFDPNRNSLETFNFPTVLYPDFGAGLFFQHQRDEYLKANAGVSVFHINKPSQSHYDLYGDYLPTKFIFHAGGEFLLENTNTALLPQVLFMKQGPFMQITAGGLVKYILGMDSKYTGYRTSSAVYFGAYYRFQDAIAFVTRYDFKQNWSAGFSYDVNVSKLRVASSGRGGMEISLAYRGFFTN